MFFIKHGFSVHPYNLSRSTQLKKSDELGLFTWFYGTDHMTTRTIIARWVSARYHRSDTRILESLMISIQIIITGLFVSRSLSILYPE
jgi:hypothetical protein